MTQGPRPRLTLELTAIAAALLLSPAALAQAPAPSTNNGLERAQKAADAVFHWIKLNGEKGANRQTPAAAPAPAPAAPAARRQAPVAAAPRPAAQPAPAPAGVERPAPTPAESAAPTFAAAPAAPAASEARPQADSAPVMLASAAPTPAPDAPMALAARAVEPPPPPQQQEEEAEVPLKLLSRVNPTIPRQLQQQSFRDGFARVKFTVAPNGSVSKAETLAASHSRLGIAAIDAVKQWRFEPIAAPREVAIEFAFSNADE